MAGFEVTTEAHKACRRVCLGPPASGPTLEHVSVVEKAIQHGAHRGGNRTVIVRHRIAAERSVCFILESLRLLGICETAGKAKADDILIGAASKGKLCAAPRACGLRLSTDFFCAKVALRRSVPCRKRAAQECPESCLGVGARSGAVCPFIMNSRHQPI
jgi:hypothetical protein